MDGWGKRLPGGFSTGPHGAGIRSRRPVHPHKSTGSHIPLPIPCYWASSSWFHARPARDGHRKVTAGFPDSSMGQGLSPTGQRLAQGRKPVSPAIPSVASLISTLGELGATAGNHGATDCGSGATLGELGATGWRAWGNGLHHVFRAWDHGGESLPPVVFWKADMFSESASMGQRLGSLSPAPGGRMQAVEPTFPAPEPSIQRVGPESPRLGTLVRADGVDEEDVGSTSQAERVTVSSTIPMGAPGFFRGTRVTGDSCRVSQMAGVSPRGIFVSNEA